MSNGFLPSFLPSFDWLIGVGDVTTRAEELEVLVTGTSELDFAELAKATEYEGGFEAKHPTVVAFWDAVFHMDPEEQKRLLMFVTGSMKASRVDSLLE